MMGNHSGSKGTPPTSAGSRNTLRSEQKMSGLFDTVQAGNTSVAGKASRPELDVMEPRLEIFREAASLAGIVPGEDLGAILPDMEEFGLMEGDYLDSFMDLSNFLLQEDSRGLNAVDSSVDNEVVNEKLDFSGIVSHLDAEATVTVEVPVMEPSIHTSSLRKRKRVDYKEMENDIVNVIDVSDMDLGLECTVSDHDYVTKSKKPRLATVQCDAPAAADVFLALAVSQTATKSAPSTSTHKPVTKYRERRDKNNEASRRSRQIRKEKFVEMDKEAEILEVRNDELRKKIVELEAMAKTMKAMLIQKMTEK